MHFMKRANTILLRVIPFVATILLLKLGAHLLEWEFISINALFSAIIGGTVFLMGFLLNGVLSDFKESEKIPGEFAASVYSVLNESEVVKAKSTELAGHIRVKALAINQGFYDWCYASIDSGRFVALIGELATFFPALEAAGLSACVNRLRTEQNTLTRLALRVEVIRKTNFISSGYLIVRATTTLLMFGLIFSRQDRVVDSFFMIAVISFLLIFLLMLIADLDNPFGHGEKGSSEDVSLYPIEELRKKNI